jgi:hypothetical protein
VTALDHPVTWAGPRPLWRGTATPSRAPTLLRFARDDFMEQLFALLESDPSQLAAHVAKYETWRTPAHETATPDLVDRVPLPKAVKDGRLQSLFRKQTAKIKAARQATQSAAAIAAPAAPPKLKLYQPAHQRFYIATATLACAVPGLPDRTLGGGHEQVGFVLRRLMRASANDPRLVEYAYIKEQQGGRWQRVSTSDDNVLAPSEEMLPVFPLGHKDHMGLRRKMWGGLIPVARREEYLAGRIEAKPVTLFNGQQETLKPTPKAKSPSKMARMTQLKMEVIEPWKALTASVLNAQAEIMDDVDAKNSAAARNQRVRTLNYQYQTQSWLLINDLALFLKDHLPEVMTVVNGNGQPASLKEAQRNLYDWLIVPVPDQTKLANGFLSQFDNPATNPADERLPKNVRPTLDTLAKALKEVSKPGVDEKLEAMVTSYQGVDAGPNIPNWPSFHFLMAGLGMDGKTDSANPAELQVSVEGLFKVKPSTPTLTQAESTLLELNSRPVIGGPNAAHPDVLALDDVTTLIVRALDAVVDEKAPPLPFAQQLSQTMRDAVNDTGLFCLRFVHVNADCGPLHAPTLSERSEQFQLASFFDSDAPARPIRITLPMDTSPAGLRKHAKGTAFVMSDMLCGQVQRAKGLGLIDLIRHVLPWPLHKELDVGDGGGCKDGNGLDIGMICSLSIPIITICALILLMIIVTLLDFIFRWIPWFIMCFPVPKLKGKPSP